MAKYKCKDCDRVFGRKQGLAVHRGVKHPAKGVFKLPLELTCGPEVVEDYTEAEWNAIQDEELGQMVSPTFNEMLGKVELPVQPEGARREPTATETGDLVECRIVGVDSDEIVAAIKQALTAEQYKGWLKGSAMTALWIGDASSLESLEDYVKMLKEAE